MSLRFRSLFTSACNSSVVCAAYASQTLTRSPRSSNVNRLIPSALHIALIRCCLFMSDCRAFYPHRFMPHSAIGFVLRLTDISCFAWVGLRPLPARKVCVRRITPTIPYAKGQMSGGGSGGVSLPDHCCLLWGRYISQKKFKFDILVKTSPLVRAFGHSHSPRQECGCNTTHPQSAFNLATCLRIQIWCAKKI